MTVMSLRLMQIALDIVQLLSLVKKIKNRVQ